MMSNAPAGAVAPYADTYKILKFGPFRFTPVSSRLSRNGVDVHLTPKAAAVLRLLLQRGGDLITKEEFLREVWSSVNVREESLTQAISTVRLALGDLPQSPRYIQTVSGEGYRFIADIVPVDAALVRAASKPIDRPRADIGLRQRIRGLLSGALFSIAVVPVVTGVL